MRAKFSTGSISFVKFSGPLISNAWVAMRCSFLPLLCDNSFLIIISFSKTRAKFGFLELSLGCRKLLDIYHAEKLNFQLFCRSFALNPQ